MKQSDFGANNWKQARRSTPALERYSNLCRPEPKHGLTAKTVLLPGEDLAEYQSFSGQIISDLAPATEVESALASELVDLQWRLLSVPTVEARILRWATVS
jgi:hypothetical protein